MNGLCLQQGVSGSSPGIPPQGFAFPTKSGNPISLTLNILEHLMFNLRFKYIINTQFIKQSYIYWNLILNFSRIFRIVSNSKI